MKNAANLIKEIEKYYSTNPSGETTIEKQASSLLLMRLALSLVEKQPDYFLTYPIKDVTSRENGLEFRVDAPLEFEQLQKEIGTELQLESRSESILVQTPAIIKKWKSLRPGDLLRVRFKIGSKNLGVVAKNPLIIFSVANASVTMTFSEKSIVEFQVTKQPVKANSP